MSDPQPKLVMLSRTKLGLLLIVAVLLGVFIGLNVPRFKSAGDEPPIRVKNGGSMEFKACNGDGWDADATSWMPASEHSHNKLTVIVSAPQCQKIAQGATQVRLRYSDDPNTDRVIMQAGGRTKLMPRNVLSEKTGDPDVLRYAASSNDADQYISQVEVLGGGQPFSCSFGSRGELNYIDVCSANGCLSCP